MKVLVFTDLQATDGHEKCFTDPTIPLQRWRVCQFYAWLREAYSQHKCHGIWDLGDTLDDRTSVPLPTLHVLHEELKLLPRSEASIKLVGNHEQWLKSPSIHSGGQFESHFNVVDTRAIHVIDGTPVICVAFHDRDDEQTAIQWLKDSLEDNPGAIVLAHAQIVGSSMPSGASTAGWSKTIFNGASLVLLGHVHRPQSLTDSIHYIGSPFQQDFGEANEAKRVALVDTKAKTVKWIPVEGFPQYRVVTWPDFKRLVNEETEDRFKVVLTSMEEVSEYYQHPLHGRAKPDYQFAMESTSDSEELSSSSGLSNRTQDILTRYVKRNPPLGVTLDENFTEADFVNFGLELGHPAE